ncbi:hypothetical protein HYG81_06390 [Natrinema zhouii]|uniref:Uncharacterized protein n=1 Tax=Natrinema zhouii TaxID=1710539 RepID=A0A7D6H4K7_9EURY|nr:hypothetical protein [Natrinema zhouii]QLK27227.1 hypothetical protein HYG81_06390 [Natrinema zhouii]
MGIQQNAMSVSRQLRDRVRSTLTNETETADDESPHSEHGDADHVSFGNLFHCSRCGDVYIATEKRVCSGCDTEVEQVRSTLA